MRSIVKNDIYILYRLDSLRMSITFSVIKNRKSAIDIHVTLSEGLCTSAVLYGYRHRSHLIYPVRFSLNNGKYQNNINITELDFKCTLTTRGLFETGWSSFDTISLSLINSDSTCIFSPIVNCPKQITYIHNDYSSESSESSKPLEPLEPLESSTPEIVSARSSSEIIEPPQEPQEPRKPKIRAKRWPMWLDAPIFYDRKKYLRLDDPPLSPSLDPPLNTSLNPL